MFLKKGLTGVMDYVSENHSKYLLMVHLIFVVKYRRNLLIKFGDEIKQIFYDIAKEKDIVIVEMEVDKNHIHLLVHYKPTMSVLDLVRWFKQISTYRLWRQNNNMMELAKFFWKKLSGQMDIYHAVLKMFLRKQLKNIYKIKVRAYIRYFKRIAVLRQYV